MKELIIYKTTALINLPRRLANYLKLPRTRLIDLNSYTIWKEREDGCTSVDIPVADVVAALRAVNITIRQVPTGFAK